MKTLKPAAVLLASFGSFACVVDAGPKGIPTGAPVATPGDLEPAALQVVPARDITTTLVEASMPVSPIDRLDADFLPKYTEHTDALHIIAKGTTAREHRIAIDSTGGEAHLFLGPQVKDPADANAALRGVVVLDPKGVQINQRAPRAEGAELIPMSAIALKGHPAGVYTIRVNDVAARAGIAVDVRQPATKLTMKLRPAAVQHLYGSPMSVEVALDEAGRGIAGANLTAYLVRPDLTRGPDVAVKELGAGRYRVEVAQALGKQDATGAHLVDVRAEGHTTSGLPFLRHGRTGFHFGVPTGRVTEVSATRIVKDAKGAIEAFEVDVRLESSAMDRLEISGTLAALGADGKEHGVAMAQTGAGFGAGVHTVTLRFAAGHIRLTKLAGTYVLRNLTVFSLSTGALFQRLAVHPARFEGVSRDMLASVKEMTPQIKGLLEAGVLAAD